MTVDGTTTATFLAGAIYSKGVKNLAAGSHGPLPSHLQLPLSQHKTKTTTAEILQVAIISANEDTQLHPQAMENVGKRGVITTKGRMVEDKIMRTEGMPGLLVHIL